MRKANTLTFDEIELGATYSFKRAVSREDIAAFASLTGDYNPIHTDEAFARNTPFGATIAHGMLAASFFSTMVGMYCPGENAILHSCTLKFVKPVRPGSIVTVSGKVIRKVEAVKLLVIETAVSDEGGATLVEGEINVKVAR